MNCNQAQNQILTADSFESEALDSDLRAHLQSCTNCKAMLARLRRLELAAQALPTVPDAQSTKQTFLALLGGAPGVATSPPVRHRFKLSWPSLTAFSVRRLAVAASILIATGLVFWGVWFHGVKQAAASDAVVERLIDWDVQIGSTESADERQKIYASLASSLQKSIANVPVKDVDQVLANKLLRLGTLLAQSTDPLDDAEQFADVADHLVDRLHAASCAGKAEDVERLTRYYAQVTTKGVVAKAAQSGHGETGSAAHHAKLERIRRHHHHLQARLDKLLAESPEPSRKQIIHALKGTNHEKGLPASTQSVPPASDD